MGWADTANAYTQQLQHGVDQQVQFDQQNAQAPLSLYDRFQKAYVQQQLMKRQEEAAKRQAEQDAQAQEQQRWSRNRIEGVDASNLEDKKRDDVMKLMGLTSEYDARSPEMAPFIQEEAKRLGRDIKLPEVQYKDTPTRQEDFMGPVNLDKPEFGGVEIKKEEDVLSGRGTKNRSAFETIMAKERDRVEAARLARDQRDRELRETEEGKNERAAARNALTAALAKMKSGGTTVNIGGSADGSMPLNPDQESAAKRILKTGEYLKPSSRLKEAWKVNARADYLAEKEGVSIIGAGAERKADAGSLASMQKQRDAVVAFESTAGKNLDIFLGAAQKLTDTGSPLLNKPVRWLEQNASGNTDVAAASAARMVALTEIAKVVSNPNLTGVLSDSARHEVESLNPKEATMAQIAAVAKVLKADMKNRKESYDVALSETKGRLNRRSGDAKSKRPTITLADGTKQQLSEDGKSWEPI